MRQAHRAYTLADEIGKGFEKLNFIRRIQLMSEIDSKCKPYLKLALEASRSYTYQLDFSRRPFRSPNQPWAIQRNRGRVLLAYLSMVEEYDQPIEFFATWCGYIDSMAYRISMSYFLAAAIDSGNKAVLNTLIDSTLGKHEIGIPSRQGIRALLLCNNESAWDAVQKVLLAAQREEGLRQVIFESIDELNPKSFRKFVRLILDHNLLRFSSCQRALQTWFPMLQNGAPVNLTETLERVLQFLDDKALLPADSDAMDVYLRLWADAYQDILVAIKRAEDYSHSDIPEVRLRVARILGSIGLTNCQSIMKRLAYDQDFSVASTAIFYYLSFGKEHHEQLGTYKIMADNCHRWPKDLKDPETRTRQDMFDDTVLVCPPSEISRWFEHLSEMSVNGRDFLAGKLGGVEDVSQRMSMAMTLLGDSSSSVRDEAIKTVESLPLRSQDAQHIEGLLKRSGADIRKMCIKLLLSQSDQSAFESASRLQAASSKLQNAGGQEVMEQLAKRGFKPAMSAQGKSEESLVVEVTPPPVALDNLIDVSKLIFAAPPKRARASFREKEIIELVSDFELFIEENRERAIRFQFHPGSNGIVETHLLGAIPMLYFSEPNPNNSIEADWQRCQLADVLDEWLELRLSKGLPTDMMLVAEAAIWIVSEGSGVRSISKDRAFQYSSKIPVAKRIELTSQCLMWLVRRNPSAISVTTLLDHLECNLVGKRIEDLKVEGFSLAEIGWRTEGVTSRTSQILAWIADTCPSSFTNEDWERCFLLHRYIDEPVGLSGRQEAMESTHKKVDRKRQWMGLELPKDKVPPRIEIPPAILDGALQAGICGPADIEDQLRISIRTATDQLHLIRRSHQYRKVVDDFVDRLITIESTRGELPTDVTRYVIDICAGVYLEQCIRLLEIGHPLARVDSYYTTLNRNQAFTRLYEYSRMKPGQTFDEAVEMIRNSKIKDDRLVEFAMAAPIWASAIEAAKEWPGFSDAVWWMQAHTREEAWGLVMDINDVRRGQVAERSRLTEGEFRQGSCDPDWFNKFNSILPEKLWRSIDKNAKFCSSSNGHVRAKIFAQALRGELKVDPFIQQIRDKRNPQAIRALGLIPIQGDAAKEVRRRYDVFQEIKVSSRQFGSARQATEKLAVDVGIENLARTAGYADPMRLVWALEADEVSDMRDGIEAVSGEVVVRLSYSELGDPVLSVTKAGKELKEIPAAAKKVPEIKELIERRKRLKLQAQRMRWSFEEAMQLGTEFEVRELESLMAHPGLKPMLESLVFVGDLGGIGFLEKGRWTGKDAKVRIAHPYDLLESQRWIEFQKQVFRDGIVQPFKQVFRELYVVTDQERGENCSTRFAGHQLRPSAAISILSKRGWVMRGEDGVSKTIYGKNVTAHIEFDEYFYTPADVEGLTIRSIVFTRSGSWNRVPPSEIPATTFSEIMRDIDLIVSVASATGFDPESSQSTVEMRSSLVRETANLLELQNVRLTDRHVLIKGELGEYSVHLGSGVVHQQAKGELVIVAVRQPQRGRLFLPFVDDDPKSAEIMSKVILLSQDSSIKDPTILHQITS